MEDEGSNNVSWIIIGVVGIIALGLLLGVVYTEFIQSDSEETSSDYISKSGTLERNVEEIFVDVVGETVNWKGEEKQTVKSIEKDELEDVLTEEYSIRISYRANVNEANAQTIRRGLLKHAMNFAENLFQNPNCSSVGGFWLTPNLMTLDKYGNEKEVQVAKIMYTRISAEKINWENMTWKLFRDILESDGFLYYFAQGLRE